MLNLRSKAGKLQRETQHLQNVKDALSQRAKILITDNPTKSKQMSRSLQIWLDQVEGLIESSHKTQDNSKERQRNFTCLGCGCRLNYNLNNEAVELLHRVDQAIKRGNGFSDEKLVSDVLDMKVKFIPMYFDVIGQENELKRALQLIIDDGDDSVGVVGICGTAGVGKTTLLKCINNYFYRKENANIFDFVIFLTSGGVDYNLCIQRMQKDIGERLGLFSLSENGDEIYQSRQIFKSLQFKNFVLLLDDVREKIDLERIGIPPLNSCVDKKQKVVITTRDKTVVCSYPRERIVEMGLLSPEESWELFSKLVNDDELLKGDVAIQTLAREIADRCGCLPSELYNVGRLMCTAKMDYEWRNAKRKLTIGKDMQNSPGDSRTLLPQHKSNFTAEGEAITDDAPEILVTLRGLETKGKSLEDQKEELERMRDVLESTTHRLVNMEALQMSYWLKETKKHLQSSSTKLQEWKSLLPSGGFSCSSIPRSSSSSNKNIDTSGKPCLSCDACNRDYNLYKEMCGLLDRGEILKMASTASLKWHEIREEPYNNVESAPPSLSEASSGTAITPPSEASLQWHGTGKEPLTGSSDKYKHVSMVEGSFPKEDSHSKGLKMVFGCDNLRPKQRLRIIRAAASISGVTSIITDEDGIGTKITVTVTGGVDPIEVVRKLRKVRAGRPISVEAI